MTQSQPQHPITYRQEIAQPLFQRLQAGESCAVVGAASVAKSNLVRFLQRADVQQHYLGAGGPRPWMPLVDTNHLAAFAEWAVYELILHCLVMEAERQEGNGEIAQRLSDLHRQVVESETPLLAQRYVERAVRMVCAEQGLRLTLLIDEADALYRDVAPRFLNSLRALRDDHRYRLTYVLLTRTPLDRLRDPAECEAFYELFNRNTLGLAPYHPDDARRMLSQLEARKAHPLSEENRRRLVRASGGHPGLLLAAFDALMSQDTDTAAAGSVEWLWANPNVRAECQKLWAGLDDDEQWALVRIQAGSPVQDSTTEDLLALKGLIVPVTSTPWRIFSPLFELYVHYSAEQDIFDFRVDEETALVWVAGQQISNLSPLEFRLAGLLHQHRDQVQSRDAILMALYPDEFEDGEMPNIQDNRVDTLIRRLRGKVEPVPGEPRYIRTVRGHGYKLASRSDPPQD